MKVFRFLKYDPVLAFGSLVAPVVSLFLALYEKSRAEEMHPHVLTISQSFAAVMLAGMAALVSLGAACLLAPRVKNPKPFPRLLAGLGTGLVTLAVASLAFSLLT